MICQNHQYEQQTQCPYCLIERNNERIIFLSTANSAIEMQKNILIEKLAKTTTALTLVASPRREDGTYNRCREAREKLAADTLKEINGL